MERIFKTGTALVCAVTLAAACGGGDDSTGGTDTPATEVTVPTTTTVTNKVTLALDRLSVAVPLADDASLTGHEYVNVIPTTEAEKGPYAAVVDDSTCANATVVGSSVKVNAKALGTCSLTITAAGGAVTTLPVQVFDPSVLDTGELLLKVITNTENKWLYAYRQDTYITDDWQTQVFRTPPPQGDGFLPFGDVGVDSTQWGAVQSLSTFVVKGKTADAVKPSDGYVKVAQRLVYPHDFLGIFDDVYWYFWRPVCSDVGTTHYVSLGYAVSRSGFPVPTRKVACVRSDLVASGSVGNDLFWQIAYSVIPPSVTEVHSEDYLSPETFTVKEDGAAAAYPYVLRVKLQPLADVAASSWRPRLSGSVCPRDSEETRPVIAKAILVPFTNVSENIACKAKPSDGACWVSPTHYGARSPFYRLERVVNYKMVACRYNDTSISQPASFGLSTGYQSSTTDEWSQKTGTSITKEGGIKLAYKGFEVSGSGSTTVSTELGYSHSTGLTELQTATPTINFDAAAGTTTAVYTDLTEFKFYRFNKDHMELIARTGGINGVSYLVTQHPPVK